MGVTPNIAPRQACGSALLVEVVATVAVAFLWNLGKLLLTLASVTSNLWLEEESEATKSTPGNWFASLIKAWGV